VKVLEDVAVGRKQQHAGLADVVGRDAEIEPVGVGADDDGLGANDEADDFDRGKTVMFRWESVASSTRWCVPLTAAKTSSSGDRVEARVDGRAARPQRVAADVDYDPVDPHVARRCGEWTSAIVASNSVCRASRHASSPASGPR
jgi:hypothetical protein